MSRRVNKDDLNSINAQTARLDLPVVGILSNPKQEWKRIAGIGGLRMAKIDIDWNKFNPKDFLFTHCFTPGNKVLMSDGTEKNIEDVVVGDFVISHLGNCKKVTKTITKKIKEEIFKLKFAGIDEINCTKEHPFYVLSKENCMCSHNKNWQKCSFGRYSKRCIYHNCCSNGNDLSFVKTEHLKNGDRSFLPKINHVILSDDFTKGKARLLGYYTAEGRVDVDNRVKNNAQKSTRFSIHVKELDTLGKDIINLMREEFGVLTYSQFGNKEQLGVTLSFVNTLAADWFLKHVGIGSTKKRFSEEVMYLDPGFQKEILFGWILGDGNDGKRDRNIRISTSSFDLSSQGLILLQRIGSFGLRSLNCDANTKEIRGKTCSISRNYHIGVQNSQLGLLSDRFPKKIFSRWRRSGQRYPTIEGFVLSELLEIKKEEYDGLVYNLSVEDDESYIINQCAVHNCTIVSSVATEDNGYYIKPVCNPIVNANGNSWTNEVLLATFKSFIGAENYLEHCQIPSQSKGKILDAVLRPFTYSDNQNNSADVFICDILVATSRTHWDLIQKIQMGQLNTLSMGCTCRQVRCSRCGKVFSDDQDSCEHIQYDLLSEFVDENGITRIVSELCGTSLPDPKTGRLVGDPESNKFIEASWVENPAFKGAVVNHLVEPTNALEKYASVFEEAQLLDEAIGDCFNVRVADRYGKICLKLAQEQHKKNIRLQTIEKVIRGK